jgi:hypothetical protein
VPAASAGTAWANSDNSNAAENRDASRVVMRLSFDAVCRDGFSRRVDMSGG